MLLGEDLEPAAGIGDGHEVLAVVDLRPEVVVERERLDRPARLGRDDEQRLVEVDRVLDRLDRARVGRVEHVQVERARDLAVGEAEHLGRERRAAHAAQHGVGVALAGHALGPLAQLGRGLEHVVGHGEPAEAVADLGPGTAPERLVLAPHALGDVLVLGLLRARLDLRGEVVGNARLDGRRAALEHGLAGLLDAGDELVEGVDELVDARP